MRPLILSMLFMTVFGGSQAANAGQMPERAGDPTISLRRLVCVPPGGGTTFIPIFVEDACTQVTERSVELSGPEGSTATVSLSALDPDAAEPWSPANDAPDLAGSAGIWSLTDLASASQPGLNSRSLLSCLSTAFSAKGVPTDALTMEYGPNQSSIQFDWSTIGGFNTEPFMPNLRCELFDLALSENQELPAVLQLRTFSAIAPILRATLSPGQRILYDEAVLDASATGAPELTADMRLVNPQTNAEITFEADKRGQVIVPAADYILIDEVTGSEVFVRLEPGQTSLAIIGIPSSSAATDVAPPAEGEGFGLGAITAFCPPNYAGPFVGCEPWEGVEVQIIVERGEAFYSDSCVTESTAAPTEARAAGCSFEVPFASTVTASIDASTIPDGYVLQRENRQTVDIPATRPDGVFSGPVFVLLPAEGNDDSTNRDGSQSDVRAVSIQVLLCRAADSDQHGCVPVMSRIGLNVQVDGEPISDGLMYTEESEIGLYRLRVDAPTAATLTVSIVDGAPDGYVPAPNSAPMKIAV